MLNNVLTKIIFLCVFILLCNIKSFSQYRIDSWTTENGLPQNSVNNLVQTEDGYIWGVTFGGIFRFDGVRFKVFNQSNTEGLEETRFRRIREDKEGRLWFFSETRSIVKYENGEFQTLTEGKDYQGVPRHYHGGKNRPLIMSTPEGHFRYENDRFVKLEIPTSNSNTDIFHIDKKGGMWLTEVGKNLRRFKDGKIEYFNFPKTDKGEDAELTKMQDDRFGNYWLSLPSIGTFRIREGKIDKVDDEYFTRGFFEDVDGNLWVIKQTSIYKIDADNLNDEKIDLNRTLRVRKEDGLTGTPVQFLIDDNENGLWAATHNGGLLRITPQAFRVFSGKDWGNESQNVYPILEDSKGNVWLGLWSNSNLKTNTIVKYDPNNKFKTYSSSPNGAKITSFYEDADGKLWVGAVGSFGNFDNEKFHEIPPPQGLGVSRTANAISRDHEGNLWLATEGGLHRYEQNKSPSYTKIDGLPDSLTTTLLKTTDGKFWVGTKKGLSYIENGKFHNITEQDDLKNDYIRSLYEDDEGVIWIGTYDAGLLRYKGGKFKRIAKKDGMFNGNVFCTLEDDNGWFWINSNNGIYRVRKQELNNFADGKIERVLSIGYTINDGLLSNEGNGGKQPAGIKRKNGELWFPTQKGVAVINPTEIETNKTPPKVHIEEVFVDKKEVKKRDESIEIQPAQSNLEINYTGLSFINPDLVKFRYRLEGFEENWNDVGTRRTAFYNNLSPGEYNFRVIAANRDGIWNAEGATIKIIKLPYYYQTWWFWGLSALLIIGIIYLIFQYRVSNLRKIAEVRSRFSQRLIESQEAERKRIAADLHDGLGQELVLIKNRAEKGLEDNSESNLKQLTDISETASLAIEEVREITNDLRPQLLDKLGLIKSIKAMLRKVSGLVEIEADIDMIDGLFSENADINIYRIIQESINNVIKHSDASSLLVRIKKQAKEIDITIKDDGRGFDIESDIGDGFGLIGLRERTKLLGGEISIDSRPQKGTIVKIKIPLTKTETP